MPERLKLASGLFNLMRNLGGAIGIAACATILNDRANLHFLRLAEHLNTANPSMADLLQRVTAVDTAKWGGDAVHGHAAALKQLWSLTWREAQTQTFADAFLVIAACFVVATLRVPLMRKVVQPAAPPAAAHWRFDRSSRKSPRLKGVEQTTSTVPRSFRSSAVRLGKSLESIAFAEGRLVFFEPERPTPRPPSPTRAGDTNGRSVLRSCRDGCRRSFWSVVPRNSSLFDFEGD
jgi:hypothetical protein